MLKILEDLVTLARERKANPIEGSYTNKLLEDKSLAKEKVLEEINELIEAVQQDTNKIQNDFPSVFRILASRETRIGYGFSYSFWAASANECLRAHGPRASAAGALTAIELQLAGHLIGPSPFNCGVQRHRQTSREDDGLQK